MKWKVNNIFSILLLTIDRTIIEWVTKDLDYRVDSQIRIDRLIVVVSITKSNQTHKWNQDQLWSSLYIRISS